MASFATRSLASSSTQRVIRPLKSASMPLPAFQKPSLGFSMRTARTPARIVCMANPRRVARVASEIQRQVGSMFASDSVVQNAISPDRRLGVDSEMSAVASVTNVHVTNDLGLVRIYYSVYSDQRGKQRAVENLKKLEPYVRKEIGRRVDLRRVPEIRFEYDNTEEEMEAVIRMIGEEDVRKAVQQLDEEAGRPTSGDTLDGFFDNLDDDEDEGEYEDREEPEEYSSLDVFNRPGPFDDLFTGRGSDLVSTIPEGSLGAGGRGQGGKGRGRGGRGGGRGRGGRGGGGRGRGRGRDVGAVTPP